MAVKWSDVSSYSQDVAKQDRVPRTWSTKLAGVLLVVTRHIDYAPDVWVVKTYPELIRMTELTARDVVKAQAEAVGKLKKRCEQILKACEI